MATTKTKSSKSNPSPAQLRARKKFAAAAKARAKAARAAKRALGIKPKKTATRKPNGFVAGGYRLEGPIKKGSKSYPAGHVFPKTIYVNADGKTVATTKADADFWGKLESSRTGRTVKLKKQTLNQNGFSYKAAGTITYARPMKSNGGKPNGFWRERLADKILGKKVKTFRQVAREKIAGKVRGKKKNGSSAAKAAYKEFTGNPSKKTVSMYAPKGSGARGSLAAMGKLKKIFVKGRKPLDFKGGANAPTLARDPKTNQMFILGKNYRLAMPRKNSNSMEDLGEITRLEYEAQKVHLGDTQTVTYYHKMGEEGGEKPHCLVNSEGLIVISGGDYTIGAEGIRN